MPSDLQSSDHNILSPFVPAIEQTALINVDSSYGSEVHVNGVNAIFTKKLTMAQTATLLNSMTVTGLYHDYRLGKVDPHLGSVAMSADFATILETMVNEAQSSSANVDQYLANQLKAAFVAAFGAALPTSNIDGTDQSAAANTAQSSSTSDPAADAGTGGQSTSVTARTTINGFAVDVNTDAAAVAAAIKNAHDANGRALLFQLVPRESVEKYMSAAHIAAGYKEVYPSTDAFPLVAGDKITFVVDINVHTAGADEAEVDANAVAEDAALPGNATATYGASTFTLNLANRRVAFEIELYGSGATAFPVGSAAGELHPLTGFPDVADPVENREGISSLPA